MLQKILKVFKIESVWKKLLFSIVALFVFRLFAAVPIPGVDVKLFRTILNNSEILQVVNLLTGGFLYSISMLTVGLGPYITASYILQILSMGFPSLKELYNGGVLERQQLNWYTRILTLPLAIGQAFVVYFSLAKLTTRFGLAPLIHVTSTLQLIAIISILVFGAFITMWLGELISMYGVGGGSSLIIMAGILISFPLNFRNALTFIPFIWQKFLILLVILVTLVLSVILSLAVYKIKVIYAQRVKATGQTQENYLPISINPAGVMPIIFGVALVSILSAGATFFSKFPEWGILYKISLSLATFFNNQILYNITLVVVTVGFTIFSALLVLRPDDMAENLAKQGAFILGIRPGKSTEDYLKDIILKVVAIGGILLGILVVLPSMFRFVLNIPILAITGSGILIVVSVIIDIIRQLQAVYANLVDTKRYF